MKTDTTNRRILPNGASLIALPSGNDAGRTVAMAQNFSVEWLSIPDRGISIDSQSETILILCAGTARLAWDRDETIMDEPAIAIVPPGTLRMTLMRGGPLLVLATDRTDLQQPGLKLLDHRPDTRIAPVGVPFARKIPLTKPLVVPFDAIANPSAHPRIRFFQSATMSVNLVRYKGARDTKALSPHAHKDIEQGTLAVHGCYIHHLRTAWGPDKTYWHDDAHIDAGTGTLLLIPPELIHTTQGVGAGTHMLLDIFAPPRRDFIAKGLMANAGDYTDSQSGGHHG